MEMLTGIPHLLLPNMVIASPTALSTHAVIAGGGELREPQEPEAGGFID